MRLPLSILTIVCALTAQSVHAADFDMELTPLVVDSTLVQVPDSLETPSTSRDWLELLKNGQLRVEDPTVHWPNRFVSWCVGVYNWYNRVFNYHDPAWVKGDGYHFHAMFLSDNWIDAYTFSYQGFPSIAMMDRLYPNLGFYLKAWSLSLGYSLDMGTIVNGEKSTHQKLSGSFSCARFTVEGQFWRSNVTTHIRYYGGYDKDHLLRIPFDGMTFRKANISAYYFFNNSRFSLGAVHSFNNNQRRSAGSAIAGVSFNMYGADFDFTKLPDELKDYQKYPFDYYTFHYRTYNLMGGYSYNWVINSKWIFNITAIPGIGITSTAGDSTIGKDVLLALYGKGMAGILYTHKRFFAGARGTFTANIFTAKEVLFINALQNYQLSVGIKF